MKIEFEGTPEFIDRMEDLMTDAMMECERHYTGRYCPREEEDYCKYRCPFNENGNDIDP